MEMPCNCSKCGEIFDLHDGRPSELWFKGEVICDDCGSIEQQIIELNEEKLEIQQEIDDAKYTIKHGNQRLSKIKKELDNLESRL